MLSPPAPSANWVPVSILTLTITWLTIHWYRRRLLARPSCHIDYFKLSGVPAPVPLPDFDIDKANARPYRPFRWKFFQTMALMPMEPDWWIELESTYKHRINQRKLLHAQHGRAILDFMPGSEAACQELMFMVIQFLCARYPQLFTLSNAKSSPTVFQNRILQTHVNISDAARDPLRFLLDNVPEDFLITQKDLGTGLYHLRGGVACSAIGWNLGTKIGKPLHEIHQPVPEFAGVLQSSVEKFFERLPVHKPIQRGSWSFELGQPLYLQSDTPEWTEHKRVDPNLCIEDVYLRVDWQTLRRIPQSQAIVFNFKALFTPVTHFQDEPYVPQLVGRVLKEAREPIREYKGWKHLEHKLIPALDKWAKEQVVRGLVPEGWEERTLDENPFYPRWNEEEEEVHKHHQTCHARS